MSSFHSFVHVILIIIFILNQSDSVEFSEKEQQSDQDLLEEERTILIVNGASLGSSLFNLTNLLPFALISTIVFLPLLLLFVLAWLLIASHAKQYDRVGYSSYSDYQRSLVSNFLDWEGVSILDMISVFTEVYRSFDPMEMDCQAKLICEVHQNVKEFGKYAEKFVDVFSYLKFSELFLPSLPDQVQELLTDYSTAANNGRGLKNDCGDIYANCNFSLKKLYDRLTSQITNNEIR